MSKDLQALLSAKVGTVAQLKKDLEPAPQVTSAADRREALKKAIVDLDDAQIERARTVMAQYVDSMVTLDPEQTAQLSPAQSKALMEEDLKRREILDLIDARKETIKELVFRSIIEDAAEKGAADPELTNGEIVVEELGYRFTREGAGPGTPSFNLKKLKEVLGDDAGKVFTAEVKIVETLNEDALSDLLAGNPELIEKVRETLVPGKPKNGSFNTRKVR